MAASFYTAGFRQVHKIVDARLKGDYPPEAVKNLHLIS